MNAGGVIAIGAFGAFAGLVFYGFGHDVLNWWEDRHALRLLNEMAEKERRADQQALFVHEHRSLQDWADQLADEITMLEIQAQAQMCGELARTLEQIRDLDEIVGVEDV